MPIPVAAGLRGYDAKAVSDEYMVDGKYEDAKWYQASTVQQQFAEEVDINTIVRRFGVTREWPVSVLGAAVYGDFTGITDYESALERIRRADESFMLLPADVRERFGNSPGELVRASESLTADEFDSLLAPEVPEAPVAPPVPATPA